MKQSFKEVKEVFEGLGILFKIFIPAVLFFPFVLTLWKYLTFDYYLFEVIPSFLFELKIVLFVVLIQFYKVLLNRVIITVLLVVFWFNFIFDNPPEDGFEIFAYALLSIGSIFAAMFMHFSAGIPAFVTNFAGITRLNNMLSFAAFLSFFPIVIYPLYIIFFPFSIPYDRLETAEEVLNKKNRVITTRELFNNGICFRNHFMGREVFRNFLVRDEHYKQRLKDMATLHDNVAPKIEEAGLRYIDFDYLPKLNDLDHMLHRDSKDHLILGGRTKAIYKKEDFHYIAWVKIDSFEVYTEMNSDSNYVVKSFPTDINFEIIEWTNERM